jgi:hypothetical protein
MMVGGALVLIVTLLIVSNARGERGPGSTADRDGGGRVPRGNYQPAPMLPNTPLMNQPGGSPINDSPDVTAVQDVRDTLRRLPLDRNNPKGWSNPKPRKPG